MSEDMVVKHCAPTLAGLKTGNIFSTSYNSLKQLKREVDDLNETLEKKGLKILVLRQSGGRALLYMYRPSQLQNDLTKEEAQRILSGFGYEKTDHRFCIRRLMQRLCDSDEFPHEIGLFLGYPPEDVKGFIECNGRDCKYCGYWKVYGDVDTAEKTFAKYSKCTCAYLNCLKNGTALSKLAVKKNEWMRTWEERCKAAGANLACDFVICNLEPDGDGITACEALGAALA